MRALTLALATALTAPTLALAEPSYHRVTGVASDDTLNVRSAPDASSADIGDLAHDATAIEVSRTDASGGWGRILWNEGNGWISMRFLAPDPQPTLGKSGLPVGLECSGTEPFWGLSLGAASARYSDIGGSDLDLNIAETLVAQGRLAWPALVSMEGPGSNGEAIVEARQCNDGMSDRDYPWQVDFILTRSGDRSFVTGCCSLPLGE